MSDSNKENGRDSSLTHVDEAGRARMVDVSDKPATRRVARARAVVQTTPAVRSALWAGELPKGEALGVARLAGIQAAKETSRLIPLCHPVALSRVAVDFAPLGEDSLEIVTEAVCTGPTGVEMEAMTAAAVAALTVYDMAKAMDRGIHIRDVALLAKSGGRSGAWTAADSDGAEA